MPGYMVEFELTKEADVLENDDGTRLCRIVAHDSGAEGVAWIHLYATVDRKKSYCIYRAPSPEAIYELAQRKGLTVSAITEIRTLQAIERFDRVA